MFASLLRVSILLAAVAAGAAFILLYPEPTPLERYGGRELVLAIRAQAPGAQALSRREMAAAVLAILRARLDPSGRGGLAEVESLPDERVRVLIPARDDQVLLPAFGESPGMTSVTLEALRRGLTLPGRLAFRLALDPNELTGDDEPPEHYQPMIAKANGQEYWVIEQGDPALWTTDIESTGVLVDEERPGTYQVLVRLKQRTRRSLNELAYLWVGERVAVLLEGELLAAPHIYVREFGEKFALTSNYTRPEAQALAIALAAGPLPAPLVVERETEIPAKPTGLLARRGLRSALAAGGCALLAALLLLSGRRRQLKASP